MSEYNFPFAADMWSTDLLPFCFCTDIQSAVEVFFCYPCAVYRLQQPHGGYFHGMMKNGTTVDENDVKNSGNAKKYDHQNNNNEMKRENSLSSPSSSSFCDCGTCMCYSCLLLPPVYFAASSWMAVRETAKKYAASGSTTVMNKQMTAAGDSTAGHLPQYPMVCHLCCPCAVVSSVYRERIIRGERLSCWNGEFADKRMLCCNWGKGNYLELYGRLYDDEEDSEEVEFIAAIERDDKDVIKKLLINSSDEFALRLLKTRRGDDSPLMTAAFCPTTSASTLNIIIDRISGLGLLSTELTSGVLKYAVQSNSAEKVALLLDRASRAAVASSKTSSPFNFEPFFAMAPPWTQQTSLMDAAVLGNIDIVKILIAYYPDNLVCEHWCSVEQNNAGKTVVDLAKKHNHTEVLTLLEETDKVNKCREWFEKTYPTRQVGSTDIRYDLKMASPINVSSDIASAPGGSGVDVQEMK